MATLTAIVEKLTRPGLLGIAGKTVEKRCQQDLSAYFKSLAKRIVALKLEDLVSGSMTPELARHAVVMRVTNAVRHDREALKQILQLNIAKAMLLADKLDSFAEKSEDKKTTPLQINQITVSGPDSDIDVLGLTGEQAAQLAALQAGNLIPGLEQTTIDLIADAVSRGISDMLGVEGTSRLIRQVADDMSVWRANLIAATEINDAMSQTALGKMKRIGIAYKQWIPDPENCCDICSDNADASPIPVDDDFPSGDDAPPAHPNCLAGDASVSAAGIAAHTIRRFEGEIIVLRCQGVDDLRITPNHPVLTDAGWVAAGELKQGMNLAHCLRPRVAVGLLAASVNPHDYLVPTRFEEVASALLKAGGMTTGTMPVTAEDFHGDATADGEVDIVLSAGFLKCEGDVSGRKNVSEASFVVRHSWGIDLPGNSSLIQAHDGLPGSTNGGVCGGGERESLLSGGLTHTHDHAFAAAADFEAVPHEGFSDVGAVATDAPSNIYARLASEIAFVKLLEFDRVPFSGQVFNLETRDGYYFANGLIVHNCRCAVAGANDPDEDDSDDNSEEE